MAKRGIIKIDEDKCNGCGLCIPNCPEGAMQVIDAKARLISDLFCDGLGACIGHCPEGAISIEEREALPYDEAKVMANIARQGGNVIKAHLLHLKEHGQKEYLRQASDYLKKNNIKNPLDGACGCPGTKIMDFRKKETVPRKEAEARSESELRQWPVQIMLVPPTAAYLDGSELLVCADCVPFAYASFHRELLRDKVLLVGCPKLDDIDYYQKKLTEVFKNNNIKSVTCAHMEVPCCFALVSVIKEAIAGSGKNILFKETVISIRGEKTS